jgi:hypothetical protein
VARSSVSRWERMAFARRRDSSYGPKASVKTIHRKEQPTHYTASDLGGWWGWWSSRSGCSCSEWWGAWAVVHGKSGNTRLEVLGSAGEVRYTAQR